MSLLIIRYEWLMLKANRMLLLCLALLGAFLLFALWTGSRHVGFQKQTIQQIKQTESRNISENRQLVDRLERTGQKFTGNSHRDPTQPDGAANGRGNRYFVLEPEPLAAVSIGQSDLYPYYYKFSMNKKQALYHSEEIQNASILYNGYFDLSFVIVFLLPLIIVAFSYNILSSEKEKGTLPLLMAAPTAIRQVILVKMGFRLSLLMAFFTTVLLAGCLFFGIPVADGNGGMGWLLLATLVYSLFWFGLCYLVNSLGKSSAFNAAMLTGTWLLLLVLIPSLISLVANEVHPMPSRLELVAETREASDSARRNSSALLAQYLEDHPELTGSGKPADLNNFALVSLRSAMAVEETIQPLEQQFRIQKQRQHEMLNRYRFASPALMMQEMLNEIAGTDERRYEAFERQTGAAHKVYRQFFAQKVFRQEKMKAFDYDHIPKPVFVAVGGGFIHRANLLNLSWLLLTSLIFIALAFTGTKSPSLAAA